MHKFTSLLALAASALAYDAQFAFNQTVEYETRSIDEIYKAALAEGGVVTLWHGGDEKNQQDAMKKAFEAAYPGMTLNITVDLSKYHDVNLDQQLATGNLYVDSVMIQTLHDYPRWKEEGALLYYAPLGFEELYTDFRDINAAYYATSIFAWSNVWSTTKLNGSGPVEYTDYLDPKYKDKIVITYPNDDDAVLYTFDLIMQQYGYEWFEALLKQNITWVRGTATPYELIGRSNNSLAVSFSTSVGLEPAAPFNVSFPTEGTFTSWPQGGAIFKDAPHPESAKLLHNFIVSKEWQRQTGTWPTRRDVDPPAGYPALWDVKSTNPSVFKDWMSDRRYVERLRFFFEDRIGTAWQVSPLDDDIN